MREHVPVCVCARACVGGGQRFTSHGTAHTSERAGRETHEYRFSRSPGGGANGSFAVWVRADEEKARVARVAAVAARNRSGEAMACESERGAVGRRRGEGEEEGVKPRRKNERGCVRGARVSVRIGCSLVLEGGKCSFGGLGLCRSSNEGELESRRLHPRRWRAELTVRSVPRS